MIEKLQIWIAWHTPRWLAYWCTIRVLAHATSGKYGNQIVPDLLAMDALKRWETSNIHGADTNKEDFGAPVLVSTPTEPEKICWEPEKICWSCLGKGDWPKPCRTCGKTKGLRQAPCVGDTGGDLVVMTEKPPMHGLWRDDPATPEGKYLVKRRDGSVPEWPSFTIGARDPCSPAALRAYAAEAMKIGLDVDYAQAVYRLADEFGRYRLEHGDGDPDRGRHRKDDPQTVAEMKLGKSV